jgi:hypothetical protein
MLLRVFSVNRRRRRRGQESSRDRANAGLGGPDCTSFAGALATSARGQEARRRNVVAVENQSQFGASRIVVREIKFPSQGSKSNVGPPAKKERRLKKYFDCIL